MRGLGAAAVMALPVGVLALVTSRLESLLVQVLDADDRSPLAYSVVALPALGIERFTDGDGFARLTFARAAVAGRMTLRVSRLGHRSRDTTLATTGASESERRVELALVRAALPLQPVRVVEWPACRRPGLPARADAAAVTILDQLQQNARRHQLLATGRPYVAVIERERTSQRMPDGAAERERIDTTRATATAEWSYQPGRVLTRDGESSMNRWSMRVPMLNDLTNPAFIGAHCFHVAGLEAKGDERLLRIDILAAERLPSADVNATVWLDPTTFLLRHAAFTITGILSGASELLHATSRLTFTAVAPLVPAMAEMVTEHLERRTGAILYVERQRVVHRSPPEAP